MREKGVERYGFHRLSCAYSMRSLAGRPRAAKRRVILAHSEKVASLAAVRDGKSIDASIAFTTAGGFLMSTLSGGVDPGLV